MADPVDKPKTKKKDIKLPPAAKVTKVEPPKGGYSDTTEFFTIVDQKFRSLTAHLATSRDYQMDDKQKEVIEKVSAATQKNRIKIINTEKF